MFSNDTFARIVRQHADTVYRVAYAWLRSPADSSDVTQDVLLALYRTDTAFASEEHLRRWLIRAAINHCKMLFRSPWHRRESIDAYENTLAFEQDADRTLFDAVMSLDKEYRMPLLLYYYEGYSTAEAAAMLGIPQRTMSTRLHRARAKLRTILEEE